ncbi:MAG: NTP transferase domain-containing protein [Bdellovibrionales bacterium]|nr:NTP transferase domain-containing protein [Bdellovibrionales bacterium]
MAAGLGTRLKPFTEDSAKAALPVMGVPMIQLAIDAASGVGARDLIVNVHAHGKAFQQVLGRMDLGGGKIRISDESKQLLGSAGGVRQALDLLGAGSFVLLNADTLNDIDLTALVKRHQELRKSHGVWMTMALFKESPMPGKYRQMKMDSSSGLIHGFDPEPKQKVPFFIGTAVVEKEAYDFLPAGKPSEFVPTVLDRLIVEKKLGFFLSDGIWFDIGSPVLWLQAHQECMRLWNQGRLPMEWKRRFMDAHVQKVSDRLFIGPIRSQADEKEWQKRLSADIEGFFYLDPARLTDWTGEDFKRTTGSVVYQVSAEMIRTNPGKGIGYEDHWVLI